LGLKYLYKKIQKNINFFYSKSFEFHFSKLICGFSFQVRTDFPKKKSLKKKIFLKFRNLHFQNSPGVSIFKS
jgi:hypothetical protein